jgi:hypothetical protein
MVSHTGCPKKIKMCVFRENNIYREGISLLKNGFPHDQMDTIAQLYTDRKHKNSKEVIPHFLTF